MKIKALSENEVTKLNYGGWLRFFRILNAVYWFFGLLLLIAIPLLIFFTWGENPKDDLDLIAVLVEILPGTVMSFLIWRAVLRQSKETPSKIGWLLKFELALHFITTAVVYYLYKQGYISDGPVPILVSIIYYFIWATYLKRSKRVFSFYGANIEKLL